MTLEEEKALLVALDNPILLEAVTEVISLHDVGFDAGYQDGLSYSIRKIHSKEVPALFQYRYLQGWEVGRNERNDRRVCKEIAKHERRLGVVVHPKEQQRLAQHEEVKTVQEPDIRPGFWSTYGTLIGTFVSTAVVAGTLGWFTGRAQEQKRCMDIKRELGVED